MTDEERAMIAEAAAHEWDTTVPRRPLPRQRFIDWHVRMAENVERRVNRLKIKTNNTPHI